MKKARKIFIVIFIVIFISILFFFHRDLLSNILNFSLRNPLTKIKKASVLGGRPRPLFDYL